MTSREQIVAYYQARVIEAKPDALLGQSLNGEISAEWRKRWLNGELDRVFPSAETLIQEMKLDERFNKEHPLTLESRAGVGKMDREI
jgi:hypothetical protein